MREGNRRRFLWIALGACSPMGVGLAAWARRRTGDRPLEECSWLLPRVGGGLATASATSWALGSEVTITALEADPGAARRGVEAALSALRQVDALMSLYRPESPLCRLNREGVLEDPHPWLVAVLRRAGSMARRSGGAFDATVQPLWEVYAEAHRAGGLPERLALEAARRRVDWRRVEVSARRVRLHGRGTAVTLNGIAQGFAADRAAAALARHGIRHALVRAGEIAALGAKPDGRPWSVGIQHPRRPEAFVSVAALRGRCLSTSGDYATSFSDDLRDHHLFDPRTGRSPQGLASVSVAAPTATEADALSTAVFVLGPEQGLELVRATPGADVLLVFKDGRTLATEGFPQSV